MGRVEILSMAVPAGAILVWSSIRRRKSESRGASRGTGDPLDPAFHDSLDDPHADSADSAPVEPEPENSCASDSDSDSGACSADAPSTGGDD